jgi:hypothetical protein
MPSCILRVCGSTAKVRRFLESSSIEPVRVFWKGEPCNPKSRGIVKVSGFNIELSRADGIDAQAAQAVRFIRKHQDDIFLIKSLGFAAAAIDFGLYDLASDDRPWPSYRLPSSFVQLASDLGCEIELSFYGVPPDAP